MRILSDTSITKDDLAATEAVLATELVRLDDQVLYLKIAIGISFIVNAALAIALKLYA